MSAEDLTAALNTARQQADALFALSEVTPEQVDEAEALMASIGQIETEQARRSEVATEAATRFASLRSQFSAGAEDEEETEEDETEDEDADEADETEVDEVEDDEVEETEEVAAATAPPFEKKKDEDDVTTASADPARSQRISAAAASRKVARKVKRPNAAQSAMVTITAAADIPNVPMGSNLSDMNAVAAAIMSRAKGFAPFNKRAAEATAAKSGGEPVLNKYAVASFGLSFDKEETAGSKNGGDDYSAVQASRKNHVARLQAGIDSVLSGKADALTAAGWCAPSPYVYNWIADYTVDGLLTLPEVSAPRGGLQITQGPQLAQSATYAGAGVDDFGFGGTEAEAIAETFDKTCETIECPDFVDHRLDWDGYCWKFPFLTEAAYPELVADALRLTDVLYAHKMNRRFINDVIAESDAVTATGLGAVFLDSLEALTQIAVKERRWWNIGENAVMEVKLPQVAREIFKFDMARRSGLALSDIATDQRIAAHFANHNLSVEYLSDFDQPNAGTTPTTEWPETLRAIIYPAGTFAKAVEPVINLSAVHDAASLSQNEYTGVFFEQGVMTMKMGYRSHVVTVPVCTAGVTGANALTCAAEPVTP